QRFGERYPFRPLTVRPQLHEVLLRFYREWRGNKAATSPQIGIVDWEDVPTRNEHFLIRDYFEDKGTKAVLADPRNLEYRNNRLYSGDFRIDLIYKRVLCRELYERMGKKSAIFEALANKNVAIANNFQALLLHKKCSLAFLSDEANHRLFNPAEIKAVEAHIPWTRHVLDRKTFYRGKQIDLLPFIAENRKDLVLKPNDS